MDVEFCKTCNLPLTEDNKCTCQRELCCKCCECAEDCECGCKAK